MTKLTVAVRVRPLSERETLAQSVAVVSVEDGRTVAVTNIKVPEQNAGDSRERVRRFHFDYCFDRDASQADVYAAISKEIVASMRDRVHLCILAYGQSASGKTHTMIGSRWSHQDVPEEVDIADGVVPRLCRHIFTYLSQTASPSELEEQTTSVSYMEIYNEKVRDLLNLPHAARGQSEVLRVREHPQTGPYVQGLAERGVASVGALLALLRVGNANRRVGATQANPSSSRSHSVFTITCLGGVKLRFVDLAGSERAGTFSALSSRCREGAHINRSLVALRNVISALAARNKSRSRFVPYRDSVLTWLLKDTLGGNSQTILVSTVSPASQNHSETVNTLRFGQRARQIAIQPVSHCLDPKETTIRELRAEISRLRRLLEHHHAGIRQQPTIVHTVQQDWETTGLITRCDSDSGLSDGRNVTHSDDSDSEHLQPTSSDVQTVDHLVPFVDVAVDTMARPSIRSLTRTMSVDHRAGSQTPTTSSLTSSQELLTDASDTRIVLKKVATDEAKKADTRVKLDTKPKPDSVGRKTQPKPRSQIVAAVTQRLYSKVKKKEAATDTCDLSDPIREMSVTSKARHRLLELTQKALKESRRKSVETQTNPFPVLRVKETATDVDDLKVLSEDLAHTGVGTDAILSQDASTECSFIDSFQSDQELFSSKAVLLTRSCGTSTECVPDPLTSPSYNLKPPPSPNSNLSFTRYLLPQKASPTFEIVNPTIANPIYTSSVNISVNHNYANSWKPPQTHSEVLSDDSLEDPGCVSNVCFPTPDLISNHNSLETHTSENYASANILEETALDGTDVPNTNESECLAKCALQELNIDPENTKLQTQFAAQVCSDEFELEDYDLFYKTPPQRFRPHLTHEVLNEPIHGEEPIILKSIMKCPDDAADETLLDVVPDSLTYYYENARKKVRFESQAQLEESKKQNDRMLDVMANFIKEVTTLMSNLTRVANRLEGNPSEQTYDMEVIIKDATSLNSLAHSDQSQFSESTQTISVETHDTSTEMQFDDFPVNRYEAFVEASCERLENALERASIERRGLYRHPTAFSLASDWNYRNMHEDSSLESQPTFSDYGSLPRRRRHRTSSYSPSSYLRQLTNMRREIIRHSRDELLHEAQMHL